jgi:arsenite-transporting ATPase
VGDAARLDGAPALPWLRAQPQRFWLFAGKGGVGKTTCAAAFALALAEDRDVLLCSADPAGSLADVLGDQAVPHRLRVLQIDAAAELERLRALYHDEVLVALESVGLAEAAALDRRVVESLWELAPPGIDEIAALTIMLAAGAKQETVVLDTAPTGHFLRLLEMPELALAWARQLMRLLVKYGGTSSGTGAAEALLQLARELRTLRELLHAADRAATVVVTLPEEVVRAETERLLERLHTQGMHVAATLINRSRADVVRGAAVIAAPLLPEPPAGASALREFAGTWKIGS